MKPIPGCLGYFVDESGRIYSNKSGRIKMLAQRLGTSGRPYVRMSHYGMSRHYYVHRLVLLAFAGPCPQGMECRHLDGNKLNNCLSNLTWGTKQENEDDRKLHGGTPVGEKNPSAKLTDSDVIQIRSERAKGCTLRQIAIRFGVNYSHVARIVKREKWRHLV